MGRARHGWRGRREAAGAPPRWVEAHATGQASHEEIDALGMTVALRRAAARALESLPVRPDVVLLDAKHDYIGRPWTVRTLIKADLHSVSVAAASVIAKECRDRLMDDIGEDYPDFAFAASPAADRERQARQVDGLSGGRGSARIQHADVFAVRLFSDTLKASLPLLSDLLPPAVAVPPRR